VPYTKWYNVHERYSLSDFRIEGYILGIVTMLLLFHIFGSRSNRSKAKAWMRAHAPLLRKEFALVGFGGVPKLDVDENDDGSQLIREKSLFEFEVYATGRQNVAFTDINLLLTKRFNPFMHAVEMFLGMFFDSYSMPQDTVEAIVYPFDGRENKTVPLIPGSELKVERSTYDNFVWAIVNKERMQKAREDRYDLSITFTKDHPKLPPWLTVMSESAEITDVLLTPELIEAATKAGDNLEYLVISDQSLDQPKTEGPPFSPSPLSFFSEANSTSRTASTKPNPASASSSATASPPITTMTSSSLSSPTSSACPTSWLSRRGSGPRCSARCATSARRRLRRCAKSKRTKRPRSETSRS
jgi:hypothetical protein